MYENKRFTLILLLITLASFTASPVLSEENGLTGIKQLNIGIFPRRSPSQTVRSFQPLATYLEKYLGIPVKIKTASNYEIFNKRLTDQQYDLVHINHTQYVKISKKSGYEVIAQSEEFHQKYLKAALFTRSDSGITDLTDLKNKKIMFGGNKSAFISYMVPKDMMHEAGLNSGDYEELFSVNPPNAVIASYKGLADASGAGNIAIFLPLVKNQVDTSKLKAISESQELPHLPWAIRGDYSVKFKNKVKSLLLTLKDTEEGLSILKAAKMTGFNVAEDADYDVARKIIQTVGMQ